MSGIAGRRYPITGGASLIGSHLTHALVEAMAGADGVFALAAYLTLPLSADPALGVEVNVMGALNVLDAARLLGGRRIVFASSIAVYGSEVHDEVTEETPFRSFDVSPAFAAYAASKLLGESRGRLYAQKHGLEVCAVRFSTVYGENQHSRGVNALYILEAMQAVRTGHPPTVRGSGAEAHDYLHAADAARGCLAAMARRRAGRVRVVADPLRGHPRQTWKLSPQPQRPFSFGFLKTKPVWNLSST